jgi:hypothetical protein
MFMCAGRQEGGAGICFSWILDKELKMKKEEPSINTMN